VDGRLAANANSFHSYSFAEALDGIAAAGFERVELCAVPGWTEHVDLARPLDLLGHDLVPVSLGAHSDLKTPEGIAHGLAAIRWAAANGVPIVTTAIGGHAHVEEREDDALRALDTLAVEAERLGVVVALEIHGDLMATGAKAAPLLERIGRPSVRVNYDTANVEFYGGVRAVDDLLPVLPWVAHVHLKDHRGWVGDWDFPALGEGTVDFAALLGLLDGFGGPLSVELEFQGEPWPPLAEVTEALRVSREHLRHLGVDA
jgi:sugar phosphate isomerase/epimerase